MFYAIRLNVGERFVANTYYTYLQLAVNDTRYSRQKWISKNGNTNYVIISLAEKSTLIFSSMYCGKVDGKR